MKRSKVLIIDSDVFFGKFLKAKLAEQNIVGVYVEDGLTAFKTAKDLGCYKYLVKTDVGIDDVVAEVERLVSKNAP